MNTSVGPVKRYLKRFPALVSAKRYLCGMFADAIELIRRSREVRTTTLDMLGSFPLFSPCSAGAYETRAALTIQAINQTIPLLSIFAKARRNRCVKLTSIEQFSTFAEHHQAVVDLKVLLDRHGSDKAAHHDYHKIYGPILSNREEVSAVLEIGLGTNNEDVVSNMGAQGRPGASLRAFRDFLKHAHIYGADVDKRVLFSEERIATYFVDQTDPESFPRLGACLPSEFDLIIDDGLHSPNANISTLNFSLERLRVGGWVVIEDIGVAATPFWEVVSALLPDSYEPYLFASSGGALAFAVKRLD